MDKPTKVVCAEQRIKDDDYNVIDWFFNKKGHDRLTIGSHKCDVETDRMKNEPGYMGWIISGYPSHPKFGEGIEGRGSNW